MSFGLLASGLGNTVIGQAQLSMSRRRHASFVAQITAADGRPGAMEAVARLARMDADRQARDNALATGIWGTLVVTGLAVFASDPDQRGGTGLGLAVGSLPGLVHHGLRWRAASRFAADFDTLHTPPPTVVPPPRR